jgi:hypothetical protein
MSCWSGEPGPATPIPGNPQLKQIFTSPAGNWDVPHPPGDGANSSIVPVVANGHVYVASYKKLDIFGFSGPVVELGVPSESGPRFGIITKVDGSRFIMKTDSGEEIQVDAEACRRLSRPRAAPFNRVQPFSESAIYGAGFSGRDSCRGDLGQYPGLKRCDLIQRHLLDLSYPHLKRRRAGCFHGVRRRTDYGTKSGVRCEQIWSGGAVRGDA